MSHLGPNVLFCWVSEEGRLKNYYTVPDGSIKDGSVPRTIREDTIPGHLFVVFKACKPLPRRMQDIPPELFLCAYRPRTASSVHHLTLQFHPHKTASVQSSDGINVSCSVRQVESFVQLLPLIQSVDIPVDTTHKQYLCYEGGMCGFTVHYEQDVFQANPKLEATLAADLAVICELLPPPVCIALRGSTSFYVNTSISFGPQSDPIVGKGATFHPHDGKDWLKRNGMMASKAGNIELYSGEDYMNSRELWGDGGVLLHELCHAYHDQHCTNGFDNEAIRDAYLWAMDKGLYNSVPVHGPQGVDATGKAQQCKAYACANQMEFFAELSVAWHWHMDEEVEYNKWFPHNRAQLQQHDPDTCALMYSVWGQRH
jgi:hypothetical protein